MIETSRECELGSPNEVNTNMSGRMDHEHFTAMYPKDSKGVRARVIGRMKK